jgi:hypothetical protein
MWKIRHNVNAMITKETAVVTVPMANRVGELALEISA